MWNLLGANESLYGVFDYIRRYGPITKKELQEYTGLSWGSISNHTARLFAQKIIVEYTGQSGGSKGRNPSSYVTNSKKNWILGMDVQMNRLCGVVVALDGSCLCSSVLNMKTREASDVFKKMLNLLELLFNSVDNPEEIRYIGLSMPGFINPVEGKPLSVHHFTGTFPADMMEIIEKQFGVPAAHFHDPDCMIMAHLNNMSREEYTALIKSNVFLIRWTYGIGSSILLNGNLHCGDHRVAGEMGHMVVDPEGPACICGNKGCLEEYASIRSILEKVSAMAKQGIFYPPHEELTCESIWAAYKEKDESVTAVVNSAIDYMASAVVSIFKLLDPRLVIIEGEFAAAPKECMDRLKTNVLSRLTENPWAEILIRPWENSGAIGAAEMLMKDLFLKILEKKTGKAGEKNEYRL